MSRSARPRRRRSEPLDPEQHLPALLRSGAARLVDLRSPRHAGRRLAELRRIAGHFASHCRRILLRDRAWLLLSHPKSGRTWLRFMLDHAGVHLPYTHCQEGSGAPMRSALLKHRRILLLHRDPRDTLVSLWFEKRTRGQGYAGTLTDLLLDPDCGLDAVMCFNLGWGEQLAETGCGLITSYELLRRDTFAEFRHILEVVRPSRAGEARVRAAVHAGRFAAMRAVERSGLGARLYGAALTPGDPSDPQSFKTRAGLVGGWTAHLTPADAAFAERLLTDRDYDARMAAYRAATIAQLPGVAARRA